MSDRSAERLGGDGQRVVDAHSETVAALPEPAAAVPEDGGQRKCVAHDATAAALPDICRSLRELQVQRRFCIGQQSRQNNALGALARRQLGWRPDLPEQERERIRKAAAVLLRALLTGKAVPPRLADDAEVLAPFVFDTAQGLAPYDERRLEIEKEMRRLAALTPGAAFAADVAGLGLLALAVVIGEAGNLSDFAGPAKLWKRLGWAPKEEYPQGEKSGGRMVPRKRKGQIYGVVVEPLIKHQVRAVKDGAGKPSGESVAVGPYGMLYLTRKSVYLARFAAEGGKSPKLHAHKLALRVMLKALLKDLWRAWNGHASADGQHSDADQIRHGADAGPVPNRRPFQMCPASRVPLSIAGRVL